MSLKLNSPFAMSEHGLPCVDIGGARINLGYARGAFDLGRGHRYYWRIDHPQWWADGGGPGLTAVSDLIFGWRKMSCVLGAFAVAAQQCRDGGVYSAGHIILLPPESSEWAILNHHHFGALSVSLEEDPHNLIVEGYLSSERN